MGSYKTLYEFGEDKFEVEKSVFIGYAKPIKTEEEAKDFIQEIKKKHRDARHNVWAYTLGQNMNIQRYSDDGEPQGTAGIPTLEVIKKENIKDAVVVVTRYFGGIKLGAGGLVRAYTKGAKIGLEAAQIVEKVLFEEARVVIDYNLLGKVQNELSSMEIHIEDTLYTEGVELVLYVRKELIEDVKSKMIDISNGKAKFILKDELFLTVINGRIVK